MKGKGIKVKKRIVSALIIICVLLSVVFIYSRIAGKKEYVEAVSESERRAAFELLSKSLNIQGKRYPEFIENIGVPYGTDEGNISEFNECKLDYNNETIIEASVPSEGLYEMEIAYSSEGASLTDYLVEIYINGKQEYEEMKSIILPLSWSDETKEFPVDSYGDEIAVAPLKYTGLLTTRLYNTTYYTVDPLLFHFEEGVNTIKIKNISNDGLVISSVKVLPKEDTLIGYEEYKAKYSGSEINDEYSVNAVDYVKKNSVAAILKSERNPSVTPYNAEYKKLNAVSGADAGIEIEYELNAPEDGLYKIGFHYRNEKEDFSSFESIRIDGQIPFKEVACYEVKTTDNKWGNETLSDESGKPYLFYLTKGVHSLSFKSESEPITRSWREGRLIAEHVTQFALDIKKVTGAQADKNRTWKMTKYIPEIEDYLNAYEVLIRDIQYNLQNYTPNGVKSAKLSELKRALAIIDQLKEYPDEIALYTENLTGNSVSANNSLLKLLGDFSSNIAKQPFELDMIYYGNVKMGRENPSVFQSIGNSLSALFYSFTSPKYKQDAKEDELEIWVNRAVTHVDLLQKMADSQFTPQTGIKVKISLIPDVNKLTLAAAANETPDLALGLQSHMPFDLSCRGALYDLSKFDDFWTFAGDFAPGAFIPFVFNEGVYAVPETSDFNLLIYRTDILQSIGVEAPSTWQELTDTLPELQRYGMNFYHNIATNIGYKWFYQTAPMIFQHKGKLYSEDGLDAMISEPDSVAGIKYLGELFSIYSIPSQIPQFNDSFRYGILPIGITNLENYNLIKNGAPELEGQWELALYPGTVQADGTIDRSYVAAGSGGVIFEASDKKDDAWRFMKWWLSRPVQVEYAHTLQATYGKENIWLPSNLAAIEDCTLPTEDKHLILEQLAYLQDVPRTPGQYLLERALSDIWNKIALDGSSAQVAVDKQIMEVQREMRKKMKDFGFIDSDGNILKPYKIHDKEWIVEQIENARKGE